MRTRRSSRTSYRSPSLPCRLFAVQSRGTRRSQPSSGRSQLVGSSRSAMPGLYQIAAMPVGPCTHSNPWHDLSFLSSHGNDRTLSNSRAVFLRSPARRPLRRPRAFRRHPIQFAGSARACRAGAELSRTGALVLANPKAIEIRFSCSIPTGLGADVGARDRRDLIASQAVINQAPIR